MRILDFRIVRYGATAGLDLNLGDGHGLYVIHGPNEAGKSTSLAALSDFLFGIAHQSDAGAVFGNDQIRLEARLALADGTQLDLRRRKGRTHTLSTPDGTPVDDSVLAAPLGAMTRERFSALFGLNDETLRTGGADLLRANGEIGRLIVEAGGGLRALVRRLEEIDARRNALFAPRRAAERAFYQASDAFRAAQKALAEASLGHDAYTRHCQLRDEARQRKAEITDEQDKLRRLHRRHEQLEKALPQLHDITRLETALAAFAPLAALPTGMGGDILAALAAQADAQAQHAAALAHATELKQQTTVPQADARLLTQREPVAQALALAQSVARLRALGPEQDRKRHSLDERLASLRQWLGQGADADLRQFMPAHPVLDTVTQLAEAQAGWQTRRTSLDQQLSETGQALAHRQARLASLRAQGRERPLQADIAAFATLAADLKRLEHRSQALAGQQQDLESRLRELGVASVMALRTLACPDTEAVRLAAEYQHRLTAERDRLDSARTAELARQATLRAQLARLDHAGHAITPAMLATARHERDGLWHAIRTAYLDPATDIPAGTRQIQAMALDAAIGQVDSLAAQLRAQADRIARIETLRHDIAHCTDTIALTERSRTQAEEQIACHWREFTAPFPAIAAHAASPTALGAFVRQRADLLADAARIASEHTAVAEERIRLDLQHDGLRRLASLAGVDPDLAPAACVAALATALQDHASGHEEYTRLQREHDDLLQARARLHQQDAALRAAGQDWSTRWATAMQALGLDGDTLPATARSLAAQWAAAPAALDQLAELKAARMQAHADETRLVQLMDTIRPHVSHPLPPDPVDAAHALERHWQAAEKARHQREALQAEHDRASRAVADGETTLQAAATVVEGLLSRTATPAPDALKQLATRLEQRDGLVAEHAQALHTLSRMADGQAPAALHAGLDGRDLPGLRAETARIEDRLKELDLQRDNAVRTEQHEEMALRAFEQNTDAPQAAARREAAVTSLHQVVEDYAELTLARNLIADAIGRIRAQEQDPLVRRAAVFFSRATQGAFSTIQTELDARNEPVVLGVRSDGSTVAVGAMSAGTRDQLFLAFRLASIKTYCEATEPLPFIADDLLVQFDDDRSRSTLRMLADFARTTQVLLFTHHDSIRDMASTLKAEGAAVHLRTLAPVPAGQPVTP